MAAAARPGQERALFQAWLAQVAQLPQYLALFADAQHDTLAAVPAFDDALLRDDVGVASAAHRATLLRLGAALVRDHVVALMPRPDGD